MAYPVYQLLQHYLAQADGKAMTPLFDLLASAVDVDISPRDKAAMTQELQAMLADVAERERVRQECLNKLTDREVSVLLMMAGGHSYQDAARLLGIGVRTVSHHLENIKSKLALKPHAGMSTVTTTQIIARVFGLDVMPRTG